MNPKLIRELQKPQDGRLLKPAGENIASVIGHLERTAPEAMPVIQEYLQIVAPMIHGVERKLIRPYRPRPCSRWWARPASPGGPLG